MMVNWHPRGNAYPIEWLLRNGRWAVPYATLRQVDIRSDAGIWGVQYELRPWLSDELLGTFDTGDEASVWAFQWMLTQDSLEHRQAATRQHERASYTSAPGKANTPEHTERD